MIARFAISIFTIIPRLLVQPATCTPHKGVPVASNSPFLEIRNSFQRTPESTCEVYLESEIHYLHDGNSGAIDTLHQELVYKIELNESWKDFCSYPILALFRQNCRGYAFDMGRGPALTPSDICLVRFFVSPYPGTHFEPPLLPQDVDASTMPCIADTFKHFYHCFNLEPPTCVSISDTSLRTCEKG